MPGICFFLEDLLGHSKHGCSGKSWTGWFTSHSQVLETGAGEAGCFDMVLSTHKSTLLPGFCALFWWSGTGEVSAGDISW